MIHAQNGIDTVMISPVLTTAAGTSLSSLDISAADYVTIRLNLAAEISTDGIGPDIDLAESDDDVASNFVTITAQLAAHDMTLAHQVRWDIDARARKKFLRLSVTTETTTNDVLTMGAIATLTRNDADPATIAARSSSTNDTVVSL